MSLLEQEFITKLLTVVTRIALGRHDCGRPLAAEVARQLARETLTELGEGWDQESRSALALRRERECRGER